jgi:hypothetical protein
VPTIVDTVDQLTPEWFTAILRLTGTLDPANSVMSAEPSRFGTGQVALVVRTELAYDATAPDAPSSVIAKLPSADDGSRGLAVGMGFYESEVRFDQDLLPLVGVATPRCYWGDIEAATGRLTLVLEDLSDGWEPGDGVNGGTPEQVQAALRELVNLHAPSWDAPLLRTNTWLTRQHRIAALSHGAIVAREMGIRCVISTQNGTLARTGDLLRADGGSGRITVPQPAP